MKDKQKEIKKERIYYAILRDQKGWEKRIKIGPNYPRIFRYPKKHKYNIVNYFPNGDMSFIPGHTLETIDFELDSKQETDHFIYLYYFEM